MFEFNRINHHNFWMKNAGKMCDYLYYNCRRNNPQSWSEADKDIVHLLKLKKNNLSEAKKTFSKLRLIPSSTIRYEKEFEKKSQNWIFKADRYTYKSRLHWVSHRNIPIYIIPGSQAVVSCVVYGHGINGVHGILQEMREELIDIHFHAITDCSENEIKKSYFINFYSSYLNYKWGKDF